jgi:hypothetical protein
MFRIFVAALTLALVALSTPASAQSAPWETTQWVAVCTLDGRQTRAARVVYAPEPGIYCGIENYTSAASGMVIDRFDISQEDVDTVLDFARFTAEAYQDWGLIAPDLLVDDPPADAPTDPGQSEGWVMNMLPEIIDDNGLTGAAYGDYQANATIPGAWGTLSIAMEGGIDRADLQQTIAHEMFHGIQYAYNATAESDDSLYFEQWVIEGMADAMSNTVVDLHETHGGILPPASALTAPLTGTVSLSRYRYTDFEGGLFTDDEDAVYDTSSFWAHLFTQQIRDMRQVDDMYRASAPGDGARYLVDAWLADSRAQSLPMVYRAFLAEVIRADSFYSGPLADALINCVVHTVTLTGTTAPTYLHNIPDVGPEQADGMRAACVDYVVEANDGPVTVTLDPKVDGAAPSPQLHLLAGDQVLSEGGEVTLATGQTHTLRTVAFFSPLDQLADAEDLITSAYRVRFEGNPQTPCAEMNGLLSVNAMGDLHFRDRVMTSTTTPEWGEAVITISALGETRTGPACMRLILSDYGDGDPTLFAQITHNPSAAVWGNERRNSVRFNIPLDAGQFDAALLRDGGELVYEQGYPISGYSAPQPGYPQQDAGFLADLPYENDFSLNGGDRIGINGHHLNTSISLNIEDAGARSVSGTFTVSTRGPGYDGRTYVGLQEITASGDFTVPVQRLGVMQDLAAWREMCFTALYEGRIHDAIPCARAHPDPVVFSDVTFTALLSASTLTETFIYFTPEEIATGFLNDADLFGGRR